MADAERPGLGEHRIHGRPHDHARFPPGWSGAPHGVRSRGARPSGASTRLPGSLPEGVGSGGLSRRCSSGGPRRSHTRRSRSPAQPRPDATMSVPRSSSRSTTLRGGTRLRGGVRVRASHRTVTTTGGQPGVRPADLARLDVRLGRRVLGRVQGAALPAAARRRRSCSCRNCLRRVLRLLDQGLHGHRLVPPRRGTRARVEEPSKADCPDRRPAVPCGVLWGGLKNRVRRRPPRSRRVGRCNRVR